MMYKNPNNILVTLLIVLVTTVFFKANAQISRVSFDACIDNMNCHLVELSLMESPTPDVLTYFRDNCTCAENINEPIPSYENIKKAIEMSELNSLKLSEDIQSIKREFKTNWSKDQAIEFIEGISNSNSHAVLQEFSENGFGYRNNPARLTRYKNIMTDISKFIEQKLQIVNTTKEVTCGVDQEYKKLLNELQDLRKQVSALENNQPQKRNSGLFTSKLNLISIGLAVFLFLILLHFFWEGRQKVRKEIVSLKSELVQLQSDFGKLGQNSDRNDKGVAKISKELNRLDRLIEVSIRAKRTTPTDFDSNSDAKSLVNQSQPASTSAQEETFYLPIPQEDNTFNAKKKTEVFEPGNTFYKFNKVSSDRAEFSFVDHEKSKPVIDQMKDKVIDIACKERNQYDDKAKIETKQPGKAKLEGDKWIITEKAEIEYVH